MLRKLFCRPFKVVELNGSSGQRQVMNHDEYVRKSIEERRTEMVLLRMGFSKPRYHVQKVEHVERR